MDRTEEVSGWLEEIDEKSSSAAYNIKATMFTSIFWVDFVDIRNSVQFCDFNTYWTTTFWFKAK